MIKFRFVLASFFVLGFLSVSVNGQQKSGKPDYAKTVIAEVGNEKITAKELQNAYQKNLSRKHDDLFSAPKDSIYDFLNLYINFRLKVNDAISRGFDKDSSVLAEINQNRKILAESFYYEKRITEPNVNYLLKQREKEYQVGIILVPVTYKPEPDSAEAWEKINIALKELKSGRDFMDVAKVHSKDVETASRGGLIPTYLTSGRVQRPIEEAIFKTPKGSFYPEIVKTQFGFFIIKVYDVAERKLVNARQILISVNETRDSASAYQKADSLYKLIKAGKSFSEMAKSNSDDKISADKGGDLGEFYSRSTGLATNGYPLVKEFENALYNLKDGEVSQPVKSEFGYHIIQRIETKDPDFEKEKADLRKVYKRLYFEEDKKAHLDSLKKVYNFKINDLALNELLINLDSNETNLKEGWDKNIAENTKRLNLYSILGQNYTTESLIGKMNSQADLRGIGTNKQGITKVINALVEPIVFNKASENLENEFTDFAQLMKEFRDGILLFKVEAIEVWDKLKFDSTKAKSFFDTLSKKFYTDEMFDITEVFILNDSISKEIYNRAKKGEDIRSIAQKETQRDGYREKMGDWGYQSVKTNVLAKHAFENKAKKGDILEPFKNGTGFSIIKINDFQKPREKKFVEAITDIAPMYQDMMQKQLSKNWLDANRKKFPVKINDKIISQLMSNR